MERRIGRPYRLGAAAVIAASGLAVTAAPATAGGPASPAGHGKWIAAEYKAASVAPHSAKAWALGERSTRSGTSDQLIAREAHGHWKLVKVHGPADLQLYDVAAGSPHKIWAVGHTGDHLTSDSPAVELSTGGDFHPVDIGDLNVGDFTAVSASSASNAWAGGTHPVYYPDKTPEIGHWDGHAWSPVDDTGQKGDNVNGISTSSPSNAWILGTKLHKADVAVWNGHSLSVMPVTRSGHIATQAIATAGAKDTWVVGGRTHRSGRVTPFATHWNGHGWKSAHVPSPAYYSEVIDIAAAGHHFFLLGSAGPRFGDDNWLPFIARYRHGKWVRMKTPHRTSYSPLYAFSMSSKTGLAVGSHDAKTARGERTQTPFTAILHGTTWKPGTAPY